MTNSPQETWPDPEQVETDADECHCACFCGNNPYCNCEPDDGCAQHSRERLAVAS